MNKVNCLVLSALILAFAFIKGANAQTQILNYTLDDSRWSAHYIYVCSGSGKCNSGIDVMNTSNEFCVRHDPTVGMSAYKIYKVDDMSKPVSVVDRINDDQHEADDFSEIQLVNAHQETSGNGPCPILDAVNQIWYKVRNDTGRPLTFLKVFTTENTGVSTVPLHMDDPVIESSLPVQAFAPLSPTTYGWTGWYNDTGDGLGNPGSGTRWYILYSNRDGCFGTSMYPAGDRSNVCEYSSEDVDDMKYYTTVVSITSLNGIGVYYPSMKNCNIPVNSYPKKYCTNQ